MSERIPDLVLERYVLGELPAHERAALGARLERDPTLAARLAAIRASNDEVLAALPAGAVAAEVARRHHLEVVAARENARARRRLWLGAGGVMAAAAALLVFVMLPREAGRGGVASTDSDEVGERAKGDPRLLVHVKRDGRVVELGAGASARPGDLVQLSYRAAGRSHGVILSIDGGGAVTLHHPEQPGGSTALQDGGAVGLSHAYELDDAPSFERFFFVTSSQPIDVTDLLERAASLAERPDEARERPLATPDVSFLLRKESSR